MERGWIKIYRKLQDNHLWKETPFSRGQAWIDLILIANHKNGYIRKRGTRIDIKAGQLAWSIKGLADRWGWSQGKVKRFLKELRNDEQIEEQNNTITTLITIRNYEDYQVNGEQSKERTESRQRADGEQTETNKNVKNDKEYNIWQDASKINQTAWGEFEQHRKEMPKKLHLTDLARKKAANKLLELAIDHKQQQAIIDQTIERSYTGLFPVNQQQQQQTTGRATQVVT